MESFQRRQNSTKAMRALFAHRYIPEAFYNMINTRSKPNRNVFRLGEKDSIHSIF